VIRERPNPPFVVAAASLAGIFLLFTASYLAPLVHRGELNSPPPLGDSPDYDNLALGLIRGRGFSLDFGDPEFRAPYEALPDSARYAPLLENRSGVPHTTARPPGLPAAMAAVYSAPRAPRSR
jgi:hypothetical protein